MTWEHILKGEKIEKEFSPILEGLETKKKKSLKKKSNNKVQLITF